MPKEPYVKPAVKSEILEPEALGQFGSSGGQDPVRFTIGQCFSNSYCCENHP